ncbi:HAD-IB family hydrolase [Clostridium sp. NSJ-49]|uniref:HAD family hydrolase n=1 Tax=Clostridium disporicum TaxID=84024 RepID=A0A174BDI8_9CLOT|nr:MULTISPECIES: HAD-IB family hydrolase [Clostridium]MBC5626642.1 HAD-IB family hydrolase [Clostridium sp. NSJ-49]MCD2500759.1 HAD-IB family hydrolase [Clostridium sp. NSJ-145]MDU6340809.1 HAD-IB family hydrolase [Clostridium sp.]CUN99062.1 HAD family hydrolase [Clostridium disporicum]
MEKVKLALFDIDYTITRKETLMEFYKYIVSKDIKNIKFLPRALYSGLMYGIKVYDEKKVKECFLKFIENIEEKDLAILTKKFYDERLSKILYKDALDMMHKLKSEGYMVILISASPEFYIKEFYAIDDVDFIIGTRFTFENGKFVRKMSGNNCKRDEKVSRLKAYLKENNIEADYENSYMFSDSLSDLPLLELVGKPYLINYNKNHNIEVLRWK